MSEVEGSLAFDGRSIPAQARETTWRARDGHPIRRIDWTHAEGGRGALLFMPGRGDCYEKHLLALHGWHAAGWQVTAIDWRGQGLSGRLGSDSTTGHIDDFTGWLDDFEAF